jgi:hypothetical protein
MTRRSASYEHRLFKYAKRGFSIGIPKNKLAVNTSQIITNRITRGNGLARLISLQAHSLLPRYHARKFRDDEIKKTRAELIQADRRAEVLGAITRETRAFTHYQVIKIPYGAQWDLQRIYTFVAGFVSKVCMA